jgi:hypothetical protein
MKYSLRSLRLHAVLLLSLWGCSLQAPAEERKIPLAPEFEPYLKWLPENTETLRGATKFTAQAITAARNDLARKPGGEKNLMPHLRSMILDPIILLDEGKVWEPLADKKISLALSGARNFETVSAFGSHRSEGCAIIVFEKELPEAGGAWLKEVRPRAKEIRKIAEREMFVFPSIVEMEAIFKLKPWQGSFIVLLNSTTLLCATSDAYLKEVLERIDHPAKGRALPSTLAEWKSVDPTSLAWMIRHVPEKQPSRRLEGVVWNQSERESKVTFFPSPGKLPAIEEFVRVRWIKSMPFTPAKVERTPGGLITASASTGGFDEASGFLMVLNHYVLDGESGSDGEN